jgi:hypothetical protein
MPRADDALVYFFPPSQLVPIFALSCKQTHCFFARRLLERLEDPLYSLGLECASYKPNVAEYPINAKERI